MSRRHPHGQRSCQCPPHEASAEAGPVSHTALPMPAQGLAHRRASLSPREPLRRGPQCRLPRNAQLPGELMPVWAAPKQSPLWLRPVGGTAPQMHRRQGWRPLRDPRRSHLLQLSPRKATDAPASAQFMGRTGGLLTAIPLGHRPSQNHRPALSLCAVPARGHQHQVPLTPPQEGSSCPHMSL